MGDFSLESPEPIEGDLIAVFSRSQYAELAREIRLTKTDKPPFLGETLHGDLSLSGRIIHGNKQSPVVGAKVTFECLAFIREETTNEDGFFTFRAMSPGDGEVVAAKDGFGREKETVRLPASEDIVLFLRPERIIHLATVDDTDKPVPGVAVECLDQQKGDLRTVVTGPEGKADLRGLHFKTYRLSLRIQHDGFVATEGFGETLTMPLLEAESSHKVVLQRAAIVKGRITDAASAEPLLGVRVIAGDILNDHVPRTWTDADGRYSLAGVRPGTVAVTAHLDGRAPELATVEAKAEDSASIDLQLGPPATVTGVIRNQGGEPIAGAEVIAVKWRDRQTLGLRAMTDRDGKFVLNNAPRDRFEYSVNARGASPYLGVVDKETALPIEITLRVGASSRTAGERAILKPGDNVPTVKLQLLDGSTFDFAAQKGKTILIIFWATWCGPCLAEVPNLVLVHEKFRGQRDFVMLGVSRDFEESALTDFLKTNPKLAWPQAFGDKGGVPEVTEAFGVSGIPAIFVIGPDGKIVASELFGEKVGETVERVLKGAAPP